MKNLLAVGLAIAALSVAPAFAQDTQDALVQGSKTESGLLIYGTSDPSSWAPIFAAFNEQYPWIKLESLNLGGNEVLERYRAESASNVKTADILMSGNPDKFTLASADHIFMPFDPVGIERYPAFAHPLPDVVTVAPEPMVMIYNKVKLPQNLWPTGFQDLADKVAANPDVFNGKVGTFDPVTSTAGPGTNIAAARVLGEPYWTALAKLAPALKFEPGAGAMLDKVTSGEYVAAYFGARFVFAPGLEGARGKIVGLTLLPDVQPFQLRAMAIAGNTKSPNSAKLFLNFLFSKEGQLANAKGGNMPYDPTLGKVDGVTTFQDILEQIGGESHAAYFGYDRGDIDSRPAFSERANKILGR